MGAHAVHVTLGPLVHLGHGPLFSSTNAYPATMQGEVTVPSITYASLEIKVRVPGVLLEVLELCARHVDSSQLLTFSTSSANPVIKLGEVTVTRITNALLKEEVSVTAVPQPLVDNLAEADRDRTPDRDPPLVASGVTAN